MCAAAVKRRYKNMQLKRIFLILISHHVVVARIKIIKKLKIQIFMCVVSKLHTRARVIRQWHINI